MSTGSISLSKQSRRTFLKGFTALLAAILSVLAFSQIFWGADSAAQAVPGPHGNFSESTTYCLLCHAMHEAPGDKLGRLSPESEICFTCHNGTGSLYNVQAQMNLDPAENAMHPIDVNLAQNPGIYIYTAVTTAGIAPPGPYRCSECHEPYGESAFHRMLKAEYDANEHADYTSSPDPYALCWSCHDSLTITNDAELFREHQRHIVEFASPCSACHYSPHGAASTELVKFNDAFVTASISAGSGPVFVDLGDNQGSCTLTCHGADHNGVQY
ncbi:MAG: hypothetical protein IBX61_02865 [Thermoleophilia bacterium]|nr:hypothetical protein [Thermoleophilia bacterium]